MVHSVLQCRQAHRSVSGVLVTQRTPSAWSQPLPDLVFSLTSGRLRFALGELATLPRAAVVVEERYSQLFALDRVRPAVIADGLAELQVRWR
jgi:hypothetical protein